MAGDRDDFAASCCKSAPTLAGKIFKAIDYDFINPGSGVLKNIFFNLFKKLDPWSYNLCTPSVDVFLNKSAHIHAATLIVKRNLQ